MHCPSATPLRPSFSGELPEAMQAASKHQGLSLMGLGRRGRFAVDQPTITGRNRLAADAEAGFAGPLNVHEIMKAYIEAGATGGRM
jgi:isocitrate lyase